MSCNPPLEGSAEGHLVKEVDALTALMALATRRTGISSAFLNSSKGRRCVQLVLKGIAILYKQAIRAELEGRPI